ncbi:Uncharacterised protein [uncultured Comamonas sp.]|nr:Uncharacterised protein [uncultured Comamonas sp.]
MSRRTVLPATALTDLLGRHVPLIARAPDGAVQGVDWDAQGAPVWTPCPALRWAAEGGAGHAGAKTIVPAASPWAALQAQETGAAAVAIPAAGLQAALAVSSIPVVVDGLADGRGLVQALDQGAHGGCLAPDAQPLAQVLAEAHRLWPIFAAASAELASPVCYAPEFERERTAPLAAWLNAVLAEERTLARAAIHVPQLPAPQRDATLAACAALRSSVRDLDAVACTRTLPLYATITQAPVAERLALWQHGLAQVQILWQQLAHTVLPHLDSAAALHALARQRAAAVP